MTARDLAEALSAEFFGGKRHEGEHFWRERRWRRACPAHDDRSSPGALYILEEPDRSFRLQCLSGCTEEAIVDAIRTKLEVDPAAVVWPPLRTDPRIKRPRGAQ